MSQIDLQTFKTAWEQADAVVQRPLLMQAIKRIATWYAVDRKIMNQAQIDFHGYYQKCVDQIGITADDARAYRSALGVYFNLRRQRLQSSTPSAPHKPTMPKNRVEFANTQSVRIRISPEMSIVFSAIRSNGKLKYEHVRYDYHVHHSGNGWLQSKALAKAQKQALMVLNTKRGHAS